MSLISQEHENLAQSKSLMDLIAEQIQNVSISDALMQYSNGVPVGVIVANMLAQMPSAETTYSKVRDAADYMTRAKLLTRKITSAGLPLYKLAAVQAQDDDISLKRHALLSASDAEALEDKAVRAVPVSFSLNRTDVYLYDSFSRGDQVIQVVVKGVPQGRNYSKDFEGRCYRLASSANSEYVKFTQVRARENLETYQRGSPPYTVSDVLYDVNLDNQLMNDYPSRARITLDYCDNYENQNVPQPSSTPDYLVVDFELVERRGNPRRSVAVTPRTPGVTLDTYITNQMRMRSRVYIVLNNTLVLVQNYRPLNRTGVHIYLPSNLSVEREGSSVIFSTSAFSNKSAKDVLSKSRSSEKQASDSASYYSEDDTKAVNTDDQSDASFEGDDETQSGEVGEVGSQKCSCNAGRAAGARRVRRARKDPVQAGRRRRTSKPLTELPEEKLLITQFEVEIVLSKDASRLATIVVDDKNAAEFIKTFDTLSTPVVFIRQQDPNDDLTGTLRKGSSTRVFILDYDDFTRSNESDTNSIATLFFPTESFKPEKLVSKTAYNSKLVLWSCSEDAALFVKTLAALVSRTRAVNSGQNLAISTEEILDQLDGSEKLLGLSLLEPTSVKSSTPTQSKELVLVLSGVAESVGKSVGEPFNLDSSRAQKTSDEYFAAENNDVHTQEAKSVESLEAVSLEFFDVDGQQVEPALASEKSLPEADVDQDQLETFSKCSSFPVDTKEPEDSFDGIKMYTINYYDTDGVLLSQSNEISEVALLNNKFPEAPTTAVSYTLKL